MKTFWSRWLGRIFPGGLFLPCPECGQRTRRAGTLCDNCLKQLHWIDDAELEFIGNDDADAATRPWQQAAALFYYEHAGRDLMHRFKFQGHPELARPLGILLAAKIRQLGLPVNAVCPIPMPRFRQWRRTYNQSELLAKVISRELGLAYLPILKRKNVSAKQALLNRKQRRRNPVGSFYFGRKHRIDADNCRLLLVDDIYSTGSTLREAAKVLHKSGLASLWIACCAVTPHR